ncbi:hypothetical protein OG320_05355 [Microbispora sp. NBC_01189]|uniref:hypothetical protein n=1 Tax=Microbispora sp. NBC_01189 TaxID=2903583 RepID=UPI002E0EEF6B|nr:hypothetical protein OG320_05355 [Microbispora sp. NBC_01189]
MTSEREQLLDTLRAVQEALDIPCPATPSDLDAYREVLEGRALHTILALWHILACPADAARHTAYLRARLAECPPTGYAPYEADEHAARAVTPAAPGSSADCEAAPHTPGREAEPHTATAKGR